MAVSKLWPVTVRLATVLDYASNPEKTTKSKSKYSDADYQALRDVVAYAKDGEKTERELFCEGIHCNPQTAREQFITVKEQFDKPDGIQAYHGYLSFEETDITPELAQQVGMAFAERMWGDRFQVLVTTHLNTEHLHCHFVVNSVSFRDGKRLQNKEKAWWYFRHIADEVCLEHGLSVVQNPEAYQSPRILTQKDKAGMPTRYNLARAALDEAIAMSHNLRQLEYHLSEMGYTLGSNPKRLMPIGMLVVLDSILNRITQNRAKGKNTFIFIDEIYLLFQHEYSANFLFTLWKRVRKYGAYATGITQNVDDLLQSHTARTMLANSEFIVMLNQASTDRLELAKLLNISDTQLSYITNVDAGHGLIKVGASLVPFANKFPKNTKLYKLMTTKPGEGG